MKKERLFAMSFFVAVLVFHGAVEAGKKVIIHVPYRVKSVKHTHTVYKVIPHHHHHHHQEKKDKRNDDESEEFDHYKK